MTNLAASALQFASALEEIINGTVSSEIEFMVDVIADSDEAFIYPCRSTPAEPFLIPITTSEYSEYAPWLFLKVVYKVSLHPERGYLTVLSSIFSLGISGRPFSPAVRIEFERGGGYEPEYESRGRHTRSAAHVQIHGTSNELYYIQHRLGLTRIRNLESFHFPVGGRRFRPSLEDFIEFLESEKLIPEIGSEARGILNKHRKIWLEIQLKAAIANSPETAANKLREMGYVVQNPK